MNLKEYYRHVLQQVMEQTELCEKPLLHCNRTDCVDARSILVSLLLDNGLTEQEVCMLTGLSQQGVNRIKNGFQQRLSRWSVRNNWLCLKERVQVAAGSLPGNA